jgi:hypothetical protein
LSTQRVKSFVLLFLIILRKLSTSSFYKKNILSYVSMFNDGLHHSTYKVEKKQKLLFSSFLSVRNKSFYNGSSAQNWLECFVLDPNFRFLKSYYILLFEGMTGQRFVDWKDTVLSTLDFESLHAFLFFLAARSITCFRSYD